MFASSFWIITRSCFYIHLGSIIWPLSSIGSLHLLKDLFWWDQEESMFRTHVAYIAFVKSFAHVQTIYRFSKERWFQYQHRTKMTATLLVVLLLSFFSTSSCTCLFKFIIYFSFSIAKLIPSPPWLKVHKRMWVPPPSSWRNWDILYKKIQQVKFVYTWCLLLLHSL